jgi:hypothetical protein
VDGTNQADLNSIHDHGDGVFSVVFSNRHAAVRLHFHCPSWQLRSAYVAGWEPLAAGSAYEATAYAICPGDRQVASRRITKVSPSTTLRSRFVPSADTLIREGLISPRERVEVRGGREVNPARRFHVTSFRMPNPPNGKRVMRPSRWGNPFTIEAEGSAAAAVAKFRHHLAAQPELVELARRELRGFDLGCTCPLDAPCHADVWLELVAQQEAGAASTTTIGSI